MQPSTILRAMLSNSSKSQKDKEEDMAILDQQVSIWLMVWSSSL